MLDSNDLIKIIKKMVVETVESTKPCNYVFGEVTKAEPLEISVELKFILSEEMLILSRSVTEHKIQIELDFDTEVENEHNHRIKHEFEIEIHSALEVGEKVILLRQQGGQKYLVLDRVVS